MKIIYDKEMPLLNRRRVSLEIEHLTSATPKKEDLRKKVADLLKENEELVFIRHAYTKFGEGISKIIAHIYKDKKNLEFFEKKKVKRKKKEKKNAKKENKK